MKQHRLRGSKNKNIDRALQIGTKITYITISSNNSIVNHGKKKERDREKERERRYSLRPIWPISLSGKTKIAVENVLKNECTNTGTNQS